MAHINTSILLVDDDADNRDMLSRRLLREGYTVAQAASGQEALGLMAMERYDLILLDIMMPGMDGTELLTRIKALAHYRDTPVIMLSALDDRAGIDHCLTLGAFDYISKPCEFNALKARMWRCFFELKRLRNIEPDSPAPRKVLIVEDNPANLELLQRRVQMLGHATVTAGHGKEALSLLNIHRVDLILLDIMMPRMDGCQRLEVLRGRPRLNRVPIIVVTAMGASSTLARCISLGANDYILKPYNAVILKDRITRALNLRESALQGNEGLPPPMPGLRGPI